MSKKLFSVLFLASMVASASVVSASAPAASTPAANTQEKKENKNPEVKNNEEKKQAVKEQKVADKPCCQDSYATRAKNAIVGAKDKVVAGASWVKSGVVTAAVTAYTKTWVEHRALTAVALVAATAVVLYNYNNTVKTKVRSWVGLNDEEVCPSSN